MTDPTLEALEWAIAEASQMARMTDLNVRYAASDLVPEMIEKSRRMWSYVLALKELRNDLIQKEQFEDLMNTLPEKP